MARGENLLGESLVGVKWDWLEVIAQAERPAGTSVNVRGTWWLCKCRCGEKIVLPRQYITQKACKSCGCKKRKKTPEEIAADKAKAGRARAEQLKGKCGNYRMPMSLSKEDQRNLRNLLDICKCHRCRKVFEKTSPDWKYQDKDKRGKRRYYCSWHCYRGDEPTVKPKMSLTERAKLQSINAV